MGAEEIQPPVSLLPPSVNSVVGLNTRACRTPSSVLVSLLPALVPSFVKWKYYPRFKRLERVDGKASGFVWTV